MRGRDLGIVIGALAIAIAAVSVSYGLQQKRYEKIDRKIDSMMPEDHGGAVEPFEPEGMLTLELVLRREKQDGGAEQTIVELVGSEDAWELPRFDETSTAQERKAYESVWFALESVLRQRIESADPAPSHVRGIAREAKDPAAKVPATDLARSLMALTRAGITDFVLLKDDPPR